MLLRHVRPLIGRVRRGINVPLFRGISTVDPGEVRKFDSIAARWWDVSSREFGALHKMNQVRVPIIRDAVLARQSGDRAVKATSRYPLDGLQILDVGCGGGILSEALGRLGANVTGIDAGEGNISAAKAHLALDPELKSRVQYECTTAEATASERGGKGKFDAVVASEVLEHVSDVPSFVQSCAYLTKPEGVVVMTTLTRSAWSFAAGVVAAEFVLGLLPPGTHDWSKFLTPAELEAELDSAGLRVDSVEGLHFDPVRQHWRRCPTVSINYAMVAHKPREIAVERSD